MFSTVNGRLHEIRVFTGNCSSEWRASSSWNHVDSFISSHLSSFHFFRFDFSLRHEQHANGAFFISWNVFVELLYAHISHISNTTSRIPYSARARRYLLPLRRYLEILLPNFCFGFSPYRSNLSYRFVYICTFFLTFPPFPFLWPGLELQAKGDRRI